MFGRRKLILVISLFAGSLACGLVATTRGSPSSNDDEPEENCGRGCWKYNHVSLVTILSAQHAYRDMVKGTDGRQQFWREDISGLYFTQLPGKSESRLELIELSVALADSAPLHRAAGFGPSKPKSGYWYETLRFEDEDKGLDSNRFSACAYPATYCKETRHSYIMDNQGRLFRKDTGGRRPVHFPTDPISEGWRRIN